MDKEPEDKNYRTRYIVSAIAISGLTLGWHLLKHMSRQDVLLPLILFLLFTFVSLFFIVTRELQSKSVRVQHVVFGVGTVFIVWIAFATNWNPGGQLRKPEPWQGWVITSDRESYDFAHSIKLLEEPKPDNFHKKGLFGIWGRTTSSEYFKHLCESEAGEFIYKTVEDVEGIYQMRPRQFTTQETFKDRYAMEDPPGYTMRIAQNPHTAFSYKKGYSFIESSQGPLWDRVKRGYQTFSEEPLNQGFKFWRYTPTNDFNSTTAENVLSLKSSHGFTWRGIKRPYDRENGIAGGELIVLDLKTNEVLAVRRHFARTGRVRDNRTGINWEFARRCPSGKKDKFWQRQTFWFVEKVLIPVNKPNIKSGEN